MLCALIAAAAGPTLRRTRGVEAEVGVVVRICGARFSGAAWTCLYVSNWATCPSSLITACLLAVGPSTACAHHQRGMCVVHVPSAGAHVSSSLS